MMIKETVFDVKNLSSRKLWELLNTDDSLDLDYYQLQLTEQELKLRGHYRQQLEQLDQQQFYYHQQWQTGIQQLG